jgi:hypothetical protein
LDEWGIAKQHNHIAAVGIDRGERLEQRMTSPPPLVLGDVDVLVATE